jgi:chemotaxis protein MotB
MNDHDLEESDNWLSISDMMSGLMFIFILIVVMYMIEANKNIAELEKTKENIEKIANNFDNVKQKISNALLLEFKDDLEKWNAEIDGTIFRFKSPDILFSRGKSSLKKEFKNILLNFFPRYINILKEFSLDIEEIRIEGHTSSKWNKDSSIEESYINNAQLSQTRALEVLKYSISKTNIENNFEWLLKVTRANGLSFSKIILNKDGTENFESSRRVEFRVMTNIENQLDKITYILNKKDN